MKKFEITKEQILEVASWGNRKDLVKLREWFPQAFESELEVGKWYKHNKFLLYIVDKTHWYGFDGCGNWNDYVKYEYLMTDKDLKPATDKEVETALIAEAKRRGFKEGVRYIAVGEEKGRVGYYYSERLRYGVGGKDALCQAGCPRIYFEGKWAEIISEPIEVTLEEIAEKFGVNVEQLKIKK